MRAKTRVRLYVAAAVLVALLAARMAAAGEGADSGTREIRIGPLAGEADRLVICAEPRPATESALVHALRRGLFDVCGGYRAGTVSADEYRAALEAYPALVLQTAALAALEQPGLGGASQPQVRRPSPTTRRQPGTAGAVPDRLCRRCADPALHDTDAGLRVLPSFEGIAMTRTNSGPPRT